VLLPSLLCAGLAHVPDAPFPCRSVCFSDPQATPIHGRRAVEGSLPYRTDGCILISYADIRLRARPVGQRCSYDTLHWLPTHLLCMSLGKYTQARAPLVPLSAELRARGGGRTGRTFNYGLLVARQIRFITARRQIELST